MIIDDKNRKNEQKKIIYGLCRKCRKNAENAEKMPKIAPKF